MKAAVDARHPFGAPNAPNTTHAAKVKDAGRTVEAVTVLKDVDAFGLVVSCGWWQRVHWAGARVINWRRFLRGAFAGREWFDEEGSVCGGELGASDAMAAGAAMKAPDAQGLLDAGVASEATAPLRVADTLSAADALEVLDGVCFVDVRDGVEIGAAADFATGSGTLVIVCVREPVLTHDVLNAVEAAKGLDAMDDLTAVIALGAKVLRG